MELDLSLIGRDRFLDKKQPRIFLTKKFNQTAKGKKPKKKKKDGEIISNGSYDL